MGKEFSLKNAFRFTTWQDYPHECDEWVMYFKQKGIPCAVLSKKSTGERYPQVFAVFRKGKDSLVDEKGPEVFTDEDQLTVLVALKGFKFVKEYEKEE